MNSKICSLCREPMREIFLSGYPIDLCERCYGVFLDAGELTLTQEQNLEVFGQKEAFGTKRDRPVALPCPACQNGMQEIVFAYDSKIYIDHCENCDGVFLDQGELLAIDNFLENIEKEPLPPNLKKALTAAKHQTNANFALQEAEVDKLYKIIDEIPGIKYLADFLSKFFFQQK